MSLDIDKCRPGTVPLAPDTVLWFEFVLDPTLLERYLCQPNPDPTPYELINCFLGLDKPDIVNIDADKIEKDDPAKTKRELAVRILTMKVMAFLKWDLEDMESKLPSRVIMKLLQGVLSIAFNDAIDYLSLNFSEVDHQGVFAALLWHRWCLKALMYNSLIWKHPRLVYIPSQGGPDPNIIAAKKREELRIQLEAQSEESIQVITNILASVENLIVPTMDSFVQPTESNPNVPVLWKPGIVVSRDELNCQVHYELAEFFMFRQDYDPAKFHLTECLKYVAALENTALSSVSFCKVEKEVVVAMATACQVPTCPSTQSNNLLDKLKASIWNNYSGVIQILQTDNLLRVIPIAERDIVEVEIQVAISSGAFTVAKDLIMKMQILNAIRRIMDQKNPSIDVLQTLRNHGDRGYDFFLTCIQSVLFDVSQKEQKNLLRFMLDLMLRDTSTPTSDGSPLKNLLLSDEAIRSHFSATELAALESLEPLIRDRTIQNVPSLLQDVSVDLISRWPKLEVMNIQQQLTQSYDAAQIKRLLNKLSSADPRKSWFTINSRWEVAIPLQSLIMSLPKCLTLDFVYILIAKSKELCSNKDFRKALQFLETAKKEAMDTPGLSSGASYKLSRLLDWEILLIEVNQYLEHYPENVVDPVLLTSACKACLAACSARDSVLPRLEVLESCALALLNLGEWESLLNMEKRWIYLELAAAFAIACQEITKYKGSKKISRTAWDLILPVFGPTTLKRNSTGSTVSPTGSTLTKSSLTRFLTQIREPTVLAAATSLLARLHNVLLDESSLEISCPYVGLWPAVVSNANSYNTRLVAEVLAQVATQTLKYNPNPLMVRKILGDLNFVVTNWASSLRCYLEAGAIASDYFSKPVPKAALDDFTYKRMIKCCQQLQSYTQAAVLCQCLDDVDYSIAFRCFSDTKNLQCSDAMDAYYSCIWDVTLLEFLVNMHSKRGETQRKHQVVKIMGLLELNSNNNEEIQREAANVRRSKLLRALTRQYSISSGTPSSVPK